MTTWPGEIFQFGLEVLTELLKETGHGPIALSGIGLIGTIARLGSMSFGQNSLMTIDNQVTGNLNFKV